jgi:hypothetical protein
MQSKGTSLKMIKMLTFCLNFFKSLINSRNADSEPDCNVEFMDSYPKGQLFMDQPDPDPLYCKFGTVLLKTC